jgi:CPA1 family monovalent cation:H+ antiporter
VLPTDIGDGRVREVLVLAAFTVVVVTLLVQGSTLPWLVRRLDQPGPDPAQDALDQAIVLQRASDAGLARLDEIARDGDSPETVESLRVWAAREADAGWERLGSNQRGETPAATFRRLRTEMLRAERELMVHVQRAGKVAAEVVDGLLQRLDQEEAMMATMSDPAPNAREDIVASVMHRGCEHLDAAPLTAVPDTPEECGDCIAIGEANWVHLRMCMACGHVGCCDSSPNRHATAHFHTSDHPVMRSIELGEAWRWCFVDSLAG